MASILSITSVLTDVITWFQTRGLLEQECPACNHNMDMQTRSDITDKYRCIHRYSIYTWIEKSKNDDATPVGSCKQSVSLQSGTFFDKSWMSLKQWLVLFYWWVREEAEVEKKTAIQAYQYCRDIFSWRLLHHEPPSPARRTRSDGSVTLPSQAQGW